VHKTSRLSRPRSFVLFMKMAVGLAVLAWAPVPASIAQEMSSKDRPASENISPADEQIARLRRQVQELSAQVAELKELVAKLEKYRQIDYVRDLLIKEEDRAASIHKELIDMAAKEVSLQKRLDEIEPQLRRDRIEQSLAGVGSMRPEDEREAVARRLNDEKQKISAELECIRRKRPRLQDSLTTAEASIARLRERLREITRKR